MAFRENLIRHINEPGGMTPENLGRISDAARTVAPDLSVLYLRNLIQGHQPKELHCEALEFALELLPYELYESDEEIGNRSVADILRVAFGALRSRESTIEFVEGLRSGYSFRTEGLTNLEILQLVEEFKSARRLEVDMDVYGLDG